MRARVLATYQILQGAPWASRDGVERTARAKASEQQTDLYTDSLGADERVQVDGARQLLLWELDAGQW